MASSLVTNLQQSLTDFLGRFSSAAGDGLDWHSVAQLPSGRMKLVLALVGVSCIWHINRWLNRRALNPSRDDVYIWDKEIVVVTGGMQIH